jgi:hypothetical protein
VLIAGGVAVLIVSRSEPLETVPARELTLPADPSLPLAPRLRPPPPAVEASLTRVARRRGDCRILVTGENKGSAPVVVALYDGDSGARLAAETIASLPGEVEFRGLPEGRHAVHLARCLACTRLTYLMRTQVEISGDGKVATAEARCVTTQVRIQLVAAQDPSAEEHRPSIAGIPVIVRRVDDPNWRYRKPYSAAAEEAIIRAGPTGVIALDDLGPGTYRVGFQGFEPLPADAARLTFAADDFDQTRPLPIRGRAH